MDRVIAPGFGWDAHSATPPAAAAAVDKITLPSRSAFRANERSSAPSEASASSETTSGDAAPLMPFALRL